MTTPRSDSTSRPAPAPSARQTASRRARSSPARFAPALAALLLLSTSARATDSIFHDGFESGEVDAWSPDEAQLRALIAGPPPSSAAVVAGLETIGRSFGLPVHTQAGTFLFAADCGTELFELVGDFNAWAPEPMGIRGQVTNSA